MGNIMKQPNYALMDYLVGLRGDLTQKQLAQNAEIKHSTYEKLEQGTRRITLKTAQKLGKYYGINPSVFLKFDPEYKLIMELDHID